MSFDENFAEAGRKALAAELKRQRGKAPVVASVRLRTSEKDTATMTCRRIIMVEKANETFEFSFIRDWGNGKIQVLKKPFRVNFVQGMTPEQIMKEYCLLFIQNFQSYDWSSYKEEK